ncbi:MAG: alpha-E domain-containing protein [Lachnospiraceae bacterium]
MGIISLEKADHLFWLGRYSERVFTTMQCFFKHFDELIDVENSKDFYINFLKALNLPDIYGDSDTFISRYLFDETDTNSLVSNMTRAFDNGIIVRDEISTVSLSYLQMSLDLLRKPDMLNNQRPLYDLQDLVDYYYAFWGSVDDCVLDEECRNIMKVGRYVERLDLYLRLKYPYVTIEKEFAKFINRLERVRMPYRSSSLEQLKEILSKGENWVESYYDAIGCLYMIFL